MGWWGNHSLGDSEDGGISPEGRVACSRARPPPPLSTTVPGLSQTFSSRLRVIQPGGEVEKNYGARWEWGEEAQSRAAAGSATFPTGPHTVTPFLAPAKS